MSKDHNSQELKDVIKAVSSDSSVASQTKTPAAAAATKNTDLRSVLKELTGENGAAMPHRTAPHQSNSNSSLHSAEKTNDLIREAKSGTQYSNGSSDSAAPPPRRTNSENLGNAVQDSYTDGYREGAETNGTSASKLTLRNIALLLTTIGLLLGGAILFMSTPQPSGPASTLQELSKELEHYRSAHQGELPNELSALSAFPKNAIEWPLRYWNARDAIGRTEIIWVPQPAGHYRIVLREADAVWTVSDRELKPKLAMKGNP